MIVGRGLQRFAAHVAGLANIDCPACCRLPSCSRAHSHVCFVTTRRCPSIKIWGAGRSAKGVKLNMKYASWAPLLECEAIITSITPKETRVVADCGKSTNSDSAMSRTQDSLRAPMFEEHIAATLNKRAFNRSSVDMKEQAAVNLGGMQREALQMAADDARHMAAERSR